jgi:hypothetical protein
MRFKEWLLTEDFQKWDGRWIHYSHGLPRSPDKGAPKVPFLKINYQMMWNDPFGIYLFPEKFEGKTGGSWHNYEFKFIVELPKNLKVFDFSKFSHEEFDKILKDSGIRSVEAYRVPVSGWNPPPAYGFWNTLKTKFYNNKTGGTLKGPLNKFFRDLGYDAIFDDTDTIHSKEVQLVLLNPAIPYKIVDIIKRSTSGWEEMTDTIKRVSEICGKYGQVNITRDNKKYSGWDHGHFLKSRIAVNEDKHREGPYASWELTTGSIEGKSPTEIHVCLSWSNPELPERRNMSICSTVSFRSMDFTETEELVKKTMDKIWELHSHP